MGVSRTKYYILFVLMVAVAFAFTGCAVIDQVFPAGDVPEQERTFYSSIKVDGLDISGKSIEEAKSMLDDAHKQLVEGKMINITLDGNSAELNVSDVTFVYNTDSILSEAIKIGWEGTRQERKAQQEDLAQNGKEYITEYTIDESALSTLLNELAAKLDITPVDAVVSFDITAEQKIVITGGDLGKKVDIEKLAQTISENLIKQDYSAIAAPFEEIQPTVTKESAASQFVMISQYSSSYHSGNGASRVFNITKACGIINGTILQPGESFSANDKLGPRNGANGWKLAHAINNGEFVDEYGGGVCQVSSTLFNAVMMADLEITERYHHSWPIGYIPIGRDATISTGGPNFVFKNQYATPIYIVMYLNTEEERVYAEIYGAPLANGMTIQVTSKKLAP
jgi:vancomycin resistance protein YoaR